MFPIEPLIESVIEKHACEIEQGRPDDEPNEVLHVRRLDQRAAAQQPGGEAVRPYGGQVGHPPQEQKSLETAVG